MAQLHGAISFTHTHTRAHNCIVPSCTVTADDLAASIHLCLGVTPISLTCHTWVLYATSA